MVDRAVSEAAAHGQTGVASPDDDGSSAPGPGPSSPAFPGQLTSTVTFVGFVRASKTADRFCDWATIALISSGVASASMV